MDISSTRANEFRVCENAEWSTNRNIMQYSAYAIFKADGVRIEALMFFTYLTGTKDYGNRLKCVVKQPGDENFTILDVVHKVQILPPLHKIVCEYQNVNRTLRKDSQILVAVIYEADFDVNLKQNETRGSVLPCSAIQYHRARVFDADKPKQQKIAHCVHMLYGIESIESAAMLKFTNWVDLQKSIGYDRIRLYVLSLNESVMEHLVKKYGQFLTFVQHSTTYGQICGWFDEHTNEIIMKHAHETCKQLFKNLFSPFDGGPHDRVCMNDCYLNFRYEYELFTNYDIDEIILPRHSEMNDLKAFEAVRCGVDGKTLDKPKYSVYDYGIKLLNRFGRGQIACLMFKHVAFLPNDASVDLFIRKLGEMLSTRSSGSASYSEGSRTVSYTLGSNDFPHVADIVNYKNLTQCLKRTDNRIAEEFRRVVAMYFGSRWGKSISDTNLTETLNHHSCDSFTHGNKFDLDLKYGYASHFRTDIAGFLDGSSQSIQHVFSDIEYFLLLHTLY